MSNYFKTVEQLIELAPKLSILLKDADKYLAHVHPVHKAEYYEEHYDRVNKYFSRLCTEHKLNATIDSLIDNFVKTNFPNSDNKALGEYFKKLFVSTPIYHDFGKINENFQAHPDKMNNPNFRIISNHPLKTHHSKLGAYLFIVKHLQESYHWQFKDKEEQRFFMLSILFFSYPIIKHHSSKLFRPDGKGISFSDTELKVMQKYIENYGFNITTKVAQGLKTQILNKNFFDWYYQKKKSLDFSFFALLRLNFSLLTAADYIATSEYVNQQEVTDFGVLCQKKQDDIINAARNSLDYNTNAYQKFESGSYELKHPIEPTNSNLNILRTEMAIEVLQTVQKYPDKRLYFLEAPTGGGKTNLSMLVLAELMKKHRALNKVYYVFPFTTLITQTHKSVIETLRLGEDDVALLHSKAGFKILKEKGDKEGAEDGLYGNLQRDFIQNMFALFPITLMTHIRFFNILKSNRKGDIYSMHRLANSIIILDELQSYNPLHWDKMIYMLDQYSRWFNIRFILMSATLPRLDKIKSVKKLPEIQDLLPNAKRYFQNPNFKDRVAFDFSLMGADGKKVIEKEELAQVVIDKSRLRADNPENKGRVFTIVEFIFKKTATTFRDEIADFEYFDIIFVLSGTILESRRREIINFLKLNKETNSLKVLLITTQVVEAGVDIDMDLGFKNVSLIDSDEQLAGRVNRNVSKKGCLVYLFNLNDAGVLYANDLRYQITRELPIEFQKEILNEKNFPKLYDKVMEEIDCQNERSTIIGFKDYHKLIKKLDFLEIHKQFLLIDQETISVFVPILLPVKIESEKGDLEDFFSPFELEFLAHYDIYPKDDGKIDGEQVWLLYLDFFKNEEKSLTKKVIQKKTIQGVLAKFTFSLFASPKNRAALVLFSHEEMSFENYFYLHRHSVVYDLEFGLNEEVLHNPDPII